MQGEKTLFNQCIHENNVQKKHARRKSRNPNVVVFDLYSSVVFK